MKLPRSFQTIILLILVLLWLICLGLSVSATLRRTGYPPVFVKANTSGSGYPIVAEITSSSMAADSALRAGDLLIRFGKSDLRGVGHIGFVIYVAEETGPEHHVTILFERGGETKQANLAIGSYAMFLPRLPASLAFMLTAIILHFRAKPSQMIRIFTWAQVCAAFLFACTFAGRWPVTYASIAVHIISLTLGAPLAVKGALLFPHGIYPKGKIAKFGPWVFALIGPLDASRVYDLPFSRELGLKGLPILSVLLLAAIIVALTINYRQADHIGRRKLKLYLFGVYCACALPMAAGVLSLFFPQFAQFVIVSAGALALIPVFLLISIMRFNLFDINRIISVTASYTILTVLFLTAFLTAIPSVARALSHSISIEPVAAQIVLSFFLAIIVVPLHRFFRPKIDKIFFTERFTFEQEIERLLILLAECQSAHQLTLLVGEQLDNLLQPETCAIYSRAREIFSPVFARGRAVPPAFEVNSPLIVLLEKRSIALSADSFSRQRSKLALSQFDRAALETLGVPVVLPIRREANLVAFVCLGPKNSGDIYTATDLALLTTVAEKVSSQLVSFDQSEVIRQSREMQETLRRYVPGVLADQIESGRNLEVGECDVTVLFVDIRGYSKYAENREAAEVFSTVNRYTLAVSESVRGQGGNVVEFNGDGMMAIFGAPQKLTHKEQAAVEAGCRIISEVNLLSVGEVGKPGLRLSVGIGIATGNAFVGNIQAVDRYIWTAIGSTTNLAARLQVLTRELDAAIVIDAKTWKHAGIVVNQFKKQEKRPIRGLAKTEDLYIIPQDSVENILKEPQSANLYEISQRS